MPVDVNGGYGFPIHVDSFMTAVGKIIYLTLSLQRVLHVVHMEIPCMAIKS